MDGEQGRLFVTDPAGIVSEWKVGIKGGAQCQANASGRNETALRTYLESHYTEGLSEEEGIHLVLSCLLEVGKGELSEAQTVSMAEQSVDIVVLRQNSVQETIAKEVLEEKIAVIKEEKKREQEEKDKEKKDEMELNLIVC